MGARIAVVIVLSTLFSYLHMLRTLRIEALTQLELYVSERGQREQSIFVLAEDNHAVLKKALEERIRALSPDKVDTRFDQLFVHLPDGTVRNRPEGFDGTRMVGLFIPKGVSVDADLRRHILASYDVLTQYGPAFHTRFTDTFITLPEGAVIVYWPEGPNWCLEAEPTYSITSHEYYTIALPEQNPQRQIAWSGIYQDEVSKYRMVAVSTPVDVDGRYVAALHHEVMLDELVARTANDKLPGTYNIIFRDDGQLIAYPGMTLESVVQPAHLRSITERVKDRRPGRSVLELPESSVYLALARLQGPDWNFATVLPESVVSRPALQAARYVLLLGVLSLLLELAIMFWVLQQQITRPLRAFTQATDKVAAGDFKVELDTSRGDELGQLT
ncbi:MAG TPA: HAMP domain-containing protein, partial [Archangium sp.]